MKNMNPEQIDPESLVDITSIQIDNALSPVERMNSYLEQIKNPYLFRCGQVVVKVSFDEKGPTLEDRLEHYIRQKNTSDHNII